VRAAFRHGGLVAAKSTDLVTGEARRRVRQQGDWQAKQEQGGCHTHTDRTTGAATRQLRRLGLVPRPAFRAPLHVPLPVREQQSLAARGLRHTQAAAGPGRCRGLPRAGEQPPPRRATPPRGSYISWSSAREEWHSSNLPCPYALGS